MLDPGQLRFIERMKSAIRRLHLKGKVVLIPRDAGVLISGAGDHYEGSVAWIQILIRIDNAIANLGWRVRFSIPGEIGSEEASLAIDHVTFRAAGAPKEQRSPMTGIARNGLRLALPLKKTQMGDESLDL